MDTRELIIKAGHTEVQYWKDLWRYRELFYFLAWRDILVRYKQTAISIAWALIRPFLTMVVFIYDIVSADSLVQLCARLAHPDATTIYSDCLCSGNGIGFGEAKLYWLGFTLSVGVVALVFASGIWYFRKMERTFADVI